MSECRLSGSVLETQKEPCSSSKLRCCCCRSEVVHPVDLCVCGAVHFRTRCVFTCVLEVFSILTRIRGTVCVLQQLAPGLGCARVCVCVRSQCAEPGAELASVEGEGGVCRERSQSGRRCWCRARRPIHQGAAHDSALSLCTDCQQVQLAVPQTVPVCAQGGDTHERYCMFYRNIEIYFDAQK